MPRVVYDKYPDVDDDGKLSQRFVNKRVNARKEGIPFDLTYAQFVDFMRCAGIVSSQCGIKGYHLSRTGDTGSYSVGNCFFRWYLDNLHEKKVTDASRTASSRNIAKATALNRQSPAKYSASISAGLARSEYGRLRKEASEARKGQYLASRHPSYAGDHNSQYGSYWITDGVGNRKWCDTKGSIPEGFYRGRIRNF